MAKRTPNKALIQSGQAVATKSVDVFYDRAVQHRTIYADGIWASITPSRELQLAFFKNLAPMPEYTRLAVTPDDKLGAELENSTKKGMIREYEATVVLSEETAQALLTLVTDILKRAKETAHKVKGNKAR